MMLYARFVHDGAEKFGIIANGTVREIDRSFFKKYSFTGREYKMKDIKLLPPCKPSKVIAVGMNYVDHIKELGNRDIPKNPVLFIKLPHTIVGHEDAVLIPKDSTRVDYEAELAVVIRKKCFNIEPEKSDEYIFGATCLNDVTERDVQKLDGQWTRAKNYKTFCPIGPWIADGLDYNKLDVKFELNGEMKQHSNTSNLLWNVQELVSFISKVIPLYQGDIVTTGTPFGVGPVKPGDIMDVTVEGIGTLRNHAAC
jgi:2-keto-4-pentenoate hydratase/2-oxohepta-3-ene-1,7-dioic acid hydratase in catechol pathway